MNSVQKKLFGFTSSLAVLGVISHGALAQMSPLGSPTTPTIPTTPTVPTTPTPLSTPTVTPTPTPSSTPTPTSTPTFTPTPESTSTPIPPSTPTPTPEPISTPTSSPAPKINQGPAPSPTSTVVGMASASSNFKTLTKALKASGLDKKLSGPGPFTVFAPTDKAFAALPAGTLETLLKPANKQKLIALLSYHVVSGQEKSTDLKAGAVPTLAGKSVMVKVQPSGISINSAKVVKADMIASNGVIHAIDKVLIPMPAKKAAAPVK
jgi:uncharacterized surface protein with fasciclin (FAS1) repeats